MARHSRRSFDLRADERRALLAALGMVERVEDQTVAEILESWSREYTEMRGQIGTMQEQMVVVLSALMGLQQAVLVVQDGETRRLRDEQRLRQSLLDEKKALVARHGADAGLWGRPRSRSSRDRRRGRLRAGAYRQSGDALAGSA